MNEQLQTALVQLLDKALVGVDAASEFLVEETPEVIQQLLVWYGVYNALLCLGGLALAYAIYKVTAIAHDKYKQSHDPDMGFFWFIAVIVATLPAIIASLMVNLTWLKIWIAPKIWLLEYASSLVK